MRITSEVMVQRSLDRLHTRLGAYERAQSELATGRRILAPSDDPAGAQRGLSLRASMRATEQQLANIGDATGWLDNADSQLRTVSGRLARVRELAVRGATDGSAAGRTAMAQEVRQIAEELVGIANTRHQGRALFGGFTGGDAVEGAAGSWTFHGRGDEVMRRVSDSERVRVNVTASEWIVGEGTVGDDDLLTILHELADDLESGTSTQISDRLGQIDLATGRVHDALAQIGAATNRVDSAKARAEDSRLTLRTELSEVEDVDIAEGLMELQVQQVAYEATLQALAKALPPSLVAFLR